MVSRRRGSGFQHQQGGAFLHFGVLKDFLKMWLTWLVVPILYEYFFSADPPELSTACINWSTAEASKSKKIQWKKACWNRRTDWWSLHNWLKFRQINYEQGPWVGHIEINETISSPKNSTLLKSSVLRPVINDSFLNFIAMAATDHLENRNHSFLPNTKQYAWDTWTNIPTQKCVPREKLAWLGYFVSTIVLFMTIVRT